MKKILITCPPMLGLKEELIPIIQEAGFEPICPNVTQTMSEEDLLELVPMCEGWIIGDDMASRRIFEKGVSGRLEGAVKWGIGVDNVDLEACKELGLPISNTPGMFGNEVADVALGYLLSLARNLHVIDKGVRAGSWPKSIGMSLDGKVAGIVGYGDIGKNTVARCQAFGLRTNVYDPGVQNVGRSSKKCDWPQYLEECDFIVFTCSLNAHNRHMLNSDVLESCKDGVRVVTVARGPLICETSLVAALKSGKVHSAALDVFEKEPLPMDSELRNFDTCIFGSHNSSNTVEGAMRASLIAIEMITQMLSKS